ncbi:cytochrome c-type biogenesis protein [Paracraurococcus ruber]|uniref:Cytochrome c-type biogenesis protein n=1 Tax=Paracraurococcus ruber TaxID=77675 RepID=A0ABS1D2V7_9PROT|nr:cytochrome c-type biogenesis protein [Paracraurococcus ruber]MBK1660607.1 cytochrome C biogenesis protein [Paracraurococcus ruber]TDG29222.1 cytochrome c-type biogenesis protein CcmH [Paracraurococcus ruber]
MTRLATLLPGLALLAAAGLAPGIPLGIPLGIAPALAAVSDPAEMLRDPGQEERARQIGRELRCMVCQNQSIEDSDAELARDLRRIVREQVSAGRSESEVLRFVHDRYGDFVLLRPPVKPETYLLWGTPVLALGAGLVLILGMRRRRAALAGEAAAELSAAERARLDRIEMQARERRGA